jgi:hypothetical protein
MAEVDSTPLMYTPMLKGKEGEFSALCGGWLGADRLLPLSHEAAGMY